MVVCYVGLSLERDKNLGKGTIFFACMQVFCKKIVWCCVAVVLCYIVLCSNCVALCSVIGCCGVVVMFR